LTIRHEVAPDPASSSELVLGHGCGAEPFERLGTYADEWLADDPDADDN
jgi:hypothetical protein